MMHSEATKLLTSAVNFCAATLTTRAVDMACLCGASHLTMEERNFLGWLANQMESDATPLPPREVMWLGAGIVNRIICLRREGKL